MIFFFVLLLIYVKKVGICVDYLLSYRFFHVLDLKILSWSCYLIHSSVPYVSYKKWDLRTWPDIKPDRFDLGEQEDVIGGGMSFIIVSCEEAHDVASYLVFFFD